MELFAALLSFAFVSSITPGPNNIMILSSGLNHGIRRSLPHLFGICCGFPVMVVLIGLGLGTVFRHYPLLHEFIKVAGVIYLLYLSWMIATAAPTSLDARVSRPIRFWQAVLFQWVNPKGWAMATGAIATYTALSLDFHRQVLVIALTFLAMTLPCCAIWLIFGAGLKQYLQRPQHLRRFNLAMAILLVISVLPVIVELGSSFL